VADRIGAAEDDVEPAGPQTMLDPVHGEPHRQQLVVAENSVLLGRQTCNIPNWSRLWATIANNLDQFAGFGAVVRFAHADVSVRGG
jgi:hypothetical protein